MVKPIRILTLLVVLGLLVGACTPPATQAPAATEAPAAEATEAPAAEATEAPAAEATEAPAAEEPTEAPAAEEGSILRIRNHADINNLDPAFWPSSTDEMVMDNIGEGLVSARRQPIRTAGGNLVGQDAGRTTIQLSCCVGSNRSSRFLPNAK